MEESNFGLAPIKREGETNFFIFTNGGGSGRMECPNCGARGPVTAVVDNNWGENCISAHLAWDARALEHKEMGYMVVAGVNLYDFQGDVRKAIDDGWEPIGGAAIANEDGIKARFFQAMVKK